MVVLETHPSYSHPNKIRLVAQKEPFMDVVLDHLEETLIQLYISKGEPHFIATFLKNFISEFYHIDLHILEVKELIIKEMWHRDLIRLEYNTIHLKIYLISPELVKIAHERLMLGLEHKWKYGTR